MIMSDEKFELTISDLAGSGTYYADIADELRARDAAQREALARVEADGLKHWQAGRDGMRDERDAWIEKHRTAKAQLAESLKHLDSVVNGYGCDMHSKPGGPREFLARHAQAEQQVAQGAQAVDERAAFEEAWIKLYRIDVEKCPEFHPKTFRIGTSYQREVGGDYIGSAWWGWQARAALATQPAERECNCPKIGERFSAEKHVGPCQVHDAVRGAEHE